MDLSQYDGVENLTQNEKALCGTLRLHPRSYLAIKQVVLREADRHGGVLARDAIQMAQVDGALADGLYDFFVSKGWILPK